MKLSKEKEVKLIVLLTPTKNKELLSALESVGGYVLNQFDVVIDYLDGDFAIILNISKSIFSNKSYSIVYEDEAEYIHDRNELKTLISQVKDVHGNGLKK